MKYRDVHRKKIVAKVDLKSGSILDKNNITYKRSDNGLQLEFIDKVFGNTINRDIKKDQGIKLEYINFNE